MKMKIKEVADLVGISVRTLHHYDEIELLKPEEVSESGYRLYSDRDLEILQQILFFKELGFPLKDIKEIIHNPSFDRVSALQLHRKMLLDKRDSINKMIRTIDKTTESIQGGIEMSNEEKFEGFDFSHNPYEQEARRRWGDQAIDQTKATIESKSKQEQMQMNQQMNEIFRKLAAHRDGSPTEEAVQQLIQEWHKYLNQSTGHHYSLEAFKALGDIYVSDERFTKNIDQFGEGLAQFMCNAMALYAEHHRE